MINIYDIDCQESNTASLYNFLLSGFSLSDFALDPSQAYQVFLIDVMSWVVSH
jgi:hypothetical protein